MSNDGLPRMTIRIPIRVGADDLINGVGWCVVHDWEFEASTDYTVEQAFIGITSQKAILACFERAFRSDGDAIWTWHEGFDGKATKAIRERAQAIVAKKFPELRMEARHG